MKKSADSSDGIHRPPSNSKLYLYDLFWHLKNCLFPRLSLQRYRPVRLLLTTLLERNIPESLLDCNGHRLYIDKKDSLRLTLNNRYEPNETSFFQKILKRDQIVIDIGANIGYFSLLFAKLVGPNGHVFAFEPDPSNYHLLTKNISANGYTNISPNPIAVSDINGESPLFLCATNAGDHRIYDSGDNRTSIRVKTICIDDFFSDFKHEISLIKMDIQGAEWKAVSGMCNLLEQNDQLSVFTEYWPRGLQLCNRADPKGFIMQLKNFGFDIYSIDPDSFEPIPADIDNITRLYTVQNNKYTNLIFMRS